MKVTINKDKESNSDFPKLMVGKNTNIIILAVDTDGLGCFSGLVLSANESWPVGRYSCSWSIDSFKDFNGSITLENE